MSKLILPAELAEIVTCLLIDPGALGELQGEDQHAQFIEAIGRVVAEHCGGEIYGVKPPEVDDPYSPADAQTQPALAVEPLDLPADRPSVWAAYDEDGWLDEEEPVDFPEFTPAELFERHHLAESLLALARSREPSGL